MLKKTIMRLRKMAGHPESKFYNPLECGKMLAIITR